MKTNKPNDLTQTLLTASEMKTVVGLLEEDQVEHLRNNTRSSEIFLNSLNQLKQSGSKVIDRPAVVQTAFFLAAGGKE